MKLILKTGTTSKRLQIFVRDSSLSTGVGLTGLTNASAGLTAYYLRDGAATSTAITLAAATVGTYASGGFIQIDATNMPGMYEFDPPDAALATGATSAVIMLKGATNMAPVLIEIQLVAFDPNAAANLGLSNLDAMVSSRSTYAGGAVASVTAAVTVGTNNDKTAYSLSAASVQAIWDALTSALTTVGSIGKRLADFITGDAFTRLGAPAGASTAADIASIKTDTGTTIPGRLPTALVGGRIDSSIGAVAAGAIAAAGLNADTDTYQAKVWLTDDNVGGNDRYIIVWFKNGQPITSGITLPTIQVFKAADGLDLIASVAMTEIGTTQTFRYNEPTNRVVNGVAYIARVGATIAGVVRTWYQPVGRDS